jgi:hypothetical protein
MLMTVEETITINKSDLEELIAKEVAKKMTAQSNKSIFLDLAIIDKRVAEINRAQSEVFDFVKEQQKKAPAYWQNISSLVQSRSRHGNGFYMTTPTLYNDPETLIRKLVCLMFGNKTVKEIDGRDINKARELYSEISNLFLTTYENHLIDVINDRKKAPN